MKRNSQQGVALVITLILLSVITFLAVTFLVVSRHEGAQVSTVVQQSNAKFAADAALEQAKAQILAQMIGTGNGLNFGMMVSTNLISPAYVEGPGAFALTNVSYNLPNANDLLPMLNNLLILPRPPVFVYTNKNQAGGGDFRYWLDLNRNGKYDTNGLVQEFNTNGDPILDASSKPIFGNYIGDPEWVGVLNQPEYRHSSSNFFVGRYCFIALPIGNSLDINYIHNQAMEISAANQMPFNQDDGYLRNQGVGSWEINLAAFLHTLTTNIWQTYNYTTPNSTIGGNTFDSFFDAAAIVQYRYNGFYNNVSNFNGTFRYYGNYLNNNSYIDALTIGPVMTNVFPDAPAYIEFSRANNTWAGADNPNAFFDTQDLFNSNPWMNNFTNRLIQAGLNTGTDERYTFYRMLSQMSFGSAPEPAPYPYTNKINLNYNNIGTNSAFGFKTFSRTTSTNFVSWTNNPVQFFTNVADRMLRQTFPYPIGILYTNSALLLATNWVQISITNIPVFPINYYTPAVHRILQQAANIFDATTSRQMDATPTSMSYPSVFRPTFSRSGVSNVFINGYVEVTESVGTTGAVDTSARHVYNLLPLSLPEQFALIPSAPATAVTNVYNVPWIIGAKKGFPNFNEFSMDSFSEITRKVQLVKSSVSAPPSSWTTNIQYLMSVSNVLGVEAWNSYAAANPRPIDIIGVDNMSMYLTNELGVLIVTNFIANPGLLFGPTGGPANGIMSFTAGQWTGYNANTHNAKNNMGMFQIPLYTNVMLLSGLTYSPGQNPVFSTNTFFQPGLGFYQPQFGLNITNRLRFVMVDHLSGRVIDYVQFGGMNYHRDLMAEIGQSTNNDGGVWATNRYAYPNGPIVGVVNQIEISEGFTNIAPYPPFTSADWQNDQISPLSESSAVMAFSKFLLGSVTNLSVQVPYTPTKFISVYNTWQANDPLVHYTLGDLTSLPLSLSVQTNYLLLNNLSGATNPAVLPNLGLINKRYFPWLNVGNTGSPDTNSINLAVKDPTVIDSDAWNFPTNAFPNVGWLGRVHRGTPWQTVYLKSAVNDSNGWTLWTGDTNLLVISNYNTAPVLVADSTFSQPYYDWQMMDLFTTSPNANASRGQLSVNQTGTAAWAAVLSGVPVLTTPTASSGLISTNIDPNQTYLGTNTIQYLVNYINAYRASLPGGVFTSVGQIAMVPQLTVASPYLGTALPTTLSDDVVERIPQEIMSLLRLGSPRYVIFSYGQSLKPADHSLVQSGNYFGMCTNYQITGEVVTRTVLRVDNFPVPGQAPTQPRVVVESFNVLPPE
jgi:hypothetical protein